MSRGVTGPTSALTDFLREKGITARGNLSRFAKRTATGEEPNSFALTHGDNSADAALAADLAAELNGGEGSSSAVAGPSRSSARAKKSVGYGENDDDDESEEADGSAQASKKAAALAKAKALAQAKASAAARKRKSFKESDDDESEDDAGQGDNDDYKEGIAAKKPATGAGKVLMKINPPASMVKPNGALAYCAGCKKRFSVTQYTAYIAKGPVCHKCGSEAQAVAEANGGGASGSGAAKKKAAPRRKLNQDAKQVVPSLRELCIRLIVKNIESVDSLRGLKTPEVDRVCKNLSKNRSLNPRTMQLFLGPEVKNLRLYDCSQLTSDSLCTVPDFCPNLESINLQLCGQLDNAAIDAWSQKLHKTLKSVELYGPFLVRVESWVKFFEALGANLQSFKIRESPRFNRTCAEALIKYCPNITELGLAQIGPLDGKMLAQFGCYDRLTYLDVSDPGVSAPGVPRTSLQDADINALLAKVGSNLEYLDLSGNTDLTDAVLTEGIKPHCPALRKLKLAKLGALTAQGLCTLFRNWPLTHGGGLTLLDVQQLLKLDDEALEAIATHSGAYLESLTLKSDNLLTIDALKKHVNPVSMPKLRMIDVGFVRAVTDSFVLDMMNGDAIRQIWVFGCNKLSDFIQSTHRVQVIGTEKGIVGNATFDRA